MKQRRATGGTSAHLLGSAQAWAAASQAGPTQRAHLGCFPRPHAATRPCRSRIDLSVQPPAVAAWQQRFRKATPRGGPQQSAALYSPACCAQEEEKKNARPHLTGCPTPASFTKSKRGSSAQPWLGSLQSHLDRRSNSQQSAPASGFHFHRQPQAEPVQDMARWQRTPLPTGACQHPKLGAASTAAGMTSLVPQCLPARGFEHSAQKPRPEKSRASTAILNC